MHVLRPLGGLAAVALLTTGLAAQSEQTLPAGFLNMSTGSASSWPFNQATDHKWQWHYDDAQFNATGPIMITEIYVRTVPTAGTMASFDFPDVEVTLASSPTEYWVGSHDTVFDNNLGSDATVVRTGPFTGTNVAAQEWIPLGMTTPFVYDPSAGDDFVVQIRKCGNNVIWGQFIDGSSGAAMQNGGNRYGSGSDCNAASSTLQNNEYVPLVKIDYGPVGPTLGVVGQCGTPGSGVQVTSATPNGPVGFAASPNPSQTNVPAGPCGTVTVAMGQPFFVLGVILADGNGTATLLPGAGIPPAACGWTMQALDFGTCTVTAPITL